MDSGNPDYCVVTMTLTGFAGCTSYTAQNWDAGGNRYGDVSLGPTDLSGFSENNLGTIAKGGQIDVRINGVASGFADVSC